jgi:hypothetical protein
MSQQYSWKVLNKQQIAPTVEWNGTHNMRLIKAGLVMIQQKS